MYLLHRYLRKFQMFKCSWTASTFSFWCLDIGRLLPLILAISITCSTLKCIPSLWCNCRYLNGLIKISLEIWNWVWIWRLVVNIFWVPFLSPFHWDFWFLFAMTWGVFCVFRPFFHPIQTSLRLMQMVLVKSRWMFHMHVFLVGLETVRLA